MNREREEEKVRAQMLGDRVLVKRTDAASKVGEIFIPDSAKAKTTTGEILAVGDEVKKVKLGQEVIFGIYAGTELELDLKPYLVLREEEVVAILRAAS